MPSNDRIIVGIDVGTHKVCTIVAEVEGGLGNRLNVLGVGAVASEGMAKGMITDVVKASGAIASSLEAAERQSGCRILSAYVSVAGNHITCMNSRGLVAISHPDRVIGQDDMDRAVEAARALAVPAGREVLHVIPRTYTVDGQEGIRNPAGMSGFRLDVETHIVMGASTVRETLIRCVQQADVEVDDLVLAPLASAEAILSEQEKNLGVVLVDIGHGTTDIAIYVEGSVWHSKVIPIGGWQLSNDLVQVVQIPYEAAEALKLQYGHAVVPGTMRQPQPTHPSSNGKSHPNGAFVHTYSSEAQPTILPHRNGASGLVANHENDPFEPDSDMLDAQTFDGNTRKVSRDYVNEIMASRLDQLFDMVSDEIRRSGYEGLLPAGVVLAGGVAQLSGIERFAGHKLRTPVRIGRPQQIGGLADIFENPAYATGVGLTLWGLKQGSQPSLPRNNSDRRAMPEAKSNTLAKWLKGFLPRG